MLSPLRARRTYLKSPPGVRSSSAHHTSALRGMLTNSTPGTIQTLWGLERPLNRAAPTLATHGTCRTKKTHLLRVDTTTHHQQAQLDQRCTKTSSARRRKLSSHVHANPTPLHTTQSQLSSATAPKRGASDLNFTRNTESNNHERSAGHVYPWAHKFFTCTRNPSRTSHDETAGLQICRLCQLAST